LTASLIRRNEVNVGATPVEFDYTGAADIIAANYRSQMQNFNYMSSVNNVSDLYKENFTKYAAAAGTDEKNLIDYTKTYADQYGKFDSVILQKRQQGEQAYNDVMTSDEIKQAAMQKARDASAEAQRVSAQASPDTWVWGSEILGAAGGWLSDPTHLIATAATLPISSVAAGATLFTGATALGTIGRIAALEGSLEAGVEAFVQYWPDGVKDWQQQLGNEYGHAEAMKSVVLAGLFSGAFTGGAMGVSKALGAKIPTHDLIAMDKEVVRQQLLKAQGPTDSEVLEAHYRNVDYLTTQLNDVDSPRLSIEGAPVGAKFVDDAVTYDHLNVSRTVPDTLDLDTHARGEFIREMVDEYTKDSGLARGDVGKMVARQGVVADELKKSIDALKTKRLELEAHNKLPADTMTASRTTTIERDIRALEKRVASLKKTEKSLGNKIDASSKAIEADEYLNVLRLGDIPAPLKPRYETYLKNVKAADAEFKAWSKKVEKVAKEIMPQSDDFIGPPTQRLQQAMNSFIGPIRRGEVYDIPDPKTVTKASKQLDEATEASFQVEAKKSLTGESKALHDYEDMDGNMVKGTAAQIDEMIKEEESFLSKFKSCFFGGAK